MLAPHQTAPPINLKLIAFGWPQPADVFSFGILALVVLSGAQNTQIPRVAGQRFALREEDGGDEFPSKEMGHVDSATTRVLMSPKVFAAESEDGGSARMAAFLELAIECIDSDAVARPTTESVVAQLAALL
eukprot:SAG11_NODE_279_length_11283_cov_11.461820_5_plen_131_part_00